MQPPGKQAEIGGTVPVSIGSANEWYSLQVCKGGERGGARRAACLGGCAGRHAK